VFADRAIERYSNKGQSPGKSEVNELGTAADKSDRLYVFHPYTVLSEHEKAGPHMMVSGSGVWTTDAAGREYIDGMAGLWCVNVGYGRTEITDAMSEQARRLPYYHSFSAMGTEPPARLAERLISLTPVPMSRVFFGNSGSDANDTQVKLVWYYNNALGRPEKKKIIARRRAYHGVTVMSGSLSGLENVYAGFDLPLPMVKHTTAPHRLWESEPGATDAEFVTRLTADLEEMIVREGPDTVAAFIAEPIQGTGGVIVPPEGYFESIQAVLRKYDILMIADEVITAFGRIGSWFASGELGIEPDLITVAKGLTSAYVPLSACIVSERVWRVLVDGGGGAAFSHGYTYSSHPLAAAAAMANLDLMVEEKMHENATTVGDYMQTELRKAFSEHPLVAEVRGRGLIAGVEFADKGDTLQPFDPALKVGPRIARACMERGLLTRALPGADTISFAPPLIINEREVDELVERARGAIDQIAEEVLRAPSGTTPSH
jgi:L-2,4-diaminobutyrate transaminase